MINYKSSASAMIYRDGGSLELRFTAEDNKDYCILIEVVSDSPNDCKRYHQPMLFKGSFSINSNKPEDFICHLTWQQLSTLIDTIKVDTGQNYKQHSDSFYFNLIKNISDNNGWLIES